MAEISPTQGVEAGGAKAGLRFKLSAMMFLQYAIWGIWAPILGLHLATLPGFQAADGTADFWRIGLVYMTMPIASIIAPFIGGQIADRYFAAQRFLGMSQLLGGVVLIVVAQLTGFAGVFIGMLVYNLLYAPTIALSNSITFQHWPNEQFSKIRVWGSIGWIVIGLVFGLIWLKYVGKLFHTPVLMVDCLYLAAVLSFAYGVYAFMLPHTPPSKQAGNPLAFLDAVGMLRNPAFAVMAIVSFFVAIELQIYFVTAQGFLNQSGGPFKAEQIASFAAQGSAAASGTQADAAAADLIAKGDLDKDKKLSRVELVQLAGSEPLAAAFLDSQDKIRAEKGGLGLDESRISPVLAIGQICELVMMVLLPIMILKYGFRVTMAVGIAAWGVRDLAFAVGQPTPLVVGAIALHGVGFAFFFTAIFMFADAIAPKDIKSSAQGFLASVTIGCGMLVGSLLAGPLTATFEGNWNKIYLAPAAMLAACCLIFLIGFRPKEATAAAEPVAQA